MPDIFDSISKKDILDKAPPMDIFDKIPEDVPFKGRHPNIYAAAKTAADMVPYLKYVDPEERERFSKLATNKQTRELLHENLNAIIGLALPSYGKAAGAVVSPIIERFLPKTFKFLTKDISLKPTAPAKVMPVEKPVIEAKPPEPMAEVKKPAVADSLPVTESVPKETIKPDIFDEIAPVGEPVGMITPPKVEPPLPETVQPAATPAGKQPWEMTRAEFDNEFFFHGKGRSHPYYGKPEISGGITRDFNEAKGFARIETSQPGEPLPGTRGPGEIQLIRKENIPEDIRQENSIASMGMDRIESDYSVPGDISNPHSYLIKKALSEGKPVPPEVLKDYPELAKETTESGLSKLASEQKQTEQAGKIIVELSKTEPKPSYNFDAPETEALFQSAKGIKPEGIIDRLKAITTEAGNKFSRDFEHLANTKENAQLVFDLKRLEKQKDVVADRTVRNIGETLSGLSKPDYELFNRKVVLDDLLSDYNRGLYQGEKELPFKFTPESLNTEKGKLDALIATNPKIGEALAKRQAMWEQVKTEYIEALKPYKPGVEDMFKENYYRHQVLDYIVNNGIFGTGKRLRPPTNKGYTKGRTGHSGVYNTDYIEAEHNIMAQMLHDAETAKTITKIQKGEDIAKEIRVMAKDQGLDDWHKAIPEGYTVWQPKEGNVFHPVLTVEEKTAEKIMAGEIDDLLEGGGDIFKQALAVGGKRKEWVVRQEVAETLNNLVRERAKGLISNLDLGVMTAWKKWQLISPRRYFKYNLRNLTGDAEATFLGNPAGFAKVPQATKELFSVFFGKKPMSKDMAAWFERGGMSSTLQAQEMDSLKNSWMFSRLSEKADLNVWKKYWNAARMTTDFRESILRYSNFLDFKEQIAKNGGKPLRYGASKPGMIDGLQDINDKAYWLSNDLLGAYDRVSVGGQTIRERLIPFWSWQEVNFKRYVQLYKNAANDGELTATIGKKLGATGIRGSMKLGALAIKTAAFASMLAVYNNIFFKEEEKQLPVDIRTKPHIIIGTDDKGGIEYFNRMGTLDDFISWFGLDAAPRFINEYMSGKKTFKELMQDQGKKTLQAPINKVIGSGMPLSKMVGEVITRKSLFPDIFKPGTIRDRYLHIARSFGLENEYIAIAGKPSKGYGESLKSTLIYKVDPGEAAFRTVYDMKADFMKKIGRSSEGFWLTPTGDALYNMKLAVKYGDKTAFTKYFNEYVSSPAQQGRSREDIRRGLQASIKAMHPLYKMNDKMKSLFIGSLNENEQQTLAEAIEFYNEVLQRKLD